MKKSFVLYTEQRETIDALTDTQAGKLLKAFYAYHADDKVNLDETLSLLFISFKQIFIRNKQKYDNKVEANRRNGLLGGRPKTQHNPTKPTGLINNPKNLDNDIALAMQQENSLAMYIEKYKSLGKTANVHDNKLYVNGKLVTNPAAHFKATAAAIENAKRVDDDYHNMPKL